MSREKPAAPTRAPYRPRAPCRSGLRADPGTAPIRAPRRSGRLGAARPGVAGGPRWPDSWQRIDGVSRLLPYSDLLTLTSSSRRGEGLSDRGSWKRMRILLTGRLDVHAEPDIDTGAALIGPHSRCCGLLQDEPPEQTAE